MSSQLTQAAQAAHHGDTTRYHQILDTLIAQAADLARLVHEDAQAHFAARQQARAEAAAPAKAGAGDAASEATTATPAFPDPTAAFERLARTVRRCIAQAEALSKPVPPKPDPAHRRTRARMALIRGVEDAICVHARHRPHADAGALRAELAERLDDPALEFDLTSRPIPELIEDICRDLGIARQGRSYIWQRRTPADIATLRTQAEAQPGTAPPILRPAPTPRGRDDPPPDFEDLLALAAQLARDG